MNLYPFAQTIAKPDCTYDDAIENIDIGGPAMVRAAAKNHESVTVIVDPADYEQVRAELEANAGATSIDTRARLAAKAFAHTAKYDTHGVAVPAVARGEPGEPFPQTLPLVYEKIQDLRYGENPHQQAAFYREPGAQGRVRRRRRRCSRARSCRSTTSPTPTPRVECVRVFDEPACVIVKHANPCGVATAGVAGGRLRRAPTAPTPRRPSAASSPSTASSMKPRRSRSPAGSSSKCIAAPSVVGRRAQRRSRSRQNVRVLVVGPLANANPSELEYRSVGGGLLVQSRDTALAQPDTFKVVSDAASRRPRSTRTCGSPGACAST